MQHGFGHWLLAGLNGCLIFSLLLIGGGMWTPLIGHATHSNYEEAFILAVAALVFLVVTALLPKYLTRFPLIRELRGTFDGELSLSDLLAQFFFLIYVNVAALVLYWIACLTIKPQSIRFYPDAAKLQGTNN